MFCVLIPLNKEGPVPAPVSKQTVPHLLHNNGGTRRCREEKAMNE